MIHDGNWVTFGVIASKSEPRSTVALVGYHLLICVWFVKVKGGKFAIWKLSDLDGTSLSLFVFGSAFVEHWKELERTVVCIANAKVLPRREVGLCYCILAQCSPERRGAGVVSRIS